MTLSTYEKARPNPHLTHDEQELVGPPPSDARDDETARRNAELIVSQLMLGEAANQARTKPAPEQALAQPAQRAAVPQSSTARGSRSQSEPVSARSTDPEVQANASLDPEDLTEATVRNAMREDLEPILDDGATDTRSWARLKYVVMGLGLGVAFLWPTLVIGAALLLIWLALIMFWILSNDTAAAFAKRRWLRFEARRPETAESFRAAADGIAMKLDIFLGLLPDRWAESLSLPDFSRTGTENAPGVGQDRKAAPF